MERIMSPVGTIGSHMPDVVLHCWTLTSPKKNDIFVVFLKKKKIIYFITDLNPAFFLRHPIFTMSIQLTYKVQ
jgi:hypothetical protein